MHSEHFSCPICFESFDSNKHLPRMLPVCGHSICHTCLSTMVKNGDMRCPLDKKPVPSSYNGIEAFPVNYLVTQLLEPAPQKELCELHKEALRFVCLADMTKLCDTCIWEARHSDHKIKPIKLIKSEAEAKKKEVDALLGKVNGCYDDISKDLEAKKAQILKAVSEKFAEMENRLKAKEIDLVSEINNFFTFGQDLSNNLVGDSSVLRYHLMQKQTSLKESFKAQEFLAKQDFFEDISEFIQKSSSELDSARLQSGLQRVKQGAKEIIDSFNTYFSQLSSSTDAELFPLIGSFEKMFKESCEKASMAIKDEVTESDFSSKVKSTFCFQYNNECLEILNGTEFSDITLELEKWREAKELNLELSQGPFNNEDVQTFSYIWKMLGKLKTFKVKISSNNASREIIDVILQKPKKFFAVEVDVAGLQFGQENPIVKLIEQMFSNNSDLRSVSLVLDETKANSDALQKVLKYAVTHHNLLEEFVLSASDTDLRDYNMDLILASMPKIKKYSLNLKNTKITDKTIQKFFVTIFPLMLELEEFSMYLYNTKVKDSTIVTTQLKFNKIRVLQLDFGKTLITDKTLDLVSQLLTASNQHLEECFLSFGRTSITDQGLVKFGQTLPNVKDLFLGVYHTDITDVSVKHFVNAIVRSMNSLEKFQMFLQGTRITDLSIDDITSVIPDVKTVSLNVSSTPITDQGLEPFLTQRLRSMKTLRKLKINVSNTSVSKSLKDKIEEFAKDLEN